MLTDEAQKQINNRKKSKQQVEDIGKGKVKQPPKTKEKTANVTIHIHSLGDHVISRQTSSDSEPAETMVAIIRSLVGMVQTAASMYNLDPVDLMDKAQRLIEEEFNTLMNNKK